MTALTENDTGYYQTEHCRVAELETLTTRTVAPAEVPLAARIEENVPVYDMTARAGDLTDPDSRRAMMAEWARVLLDGPGVFVLEKAQTDLGAIEHATEVFERIIAVEKQGGAQADHFAAAGSNDRIWNALQKLCEADPECFASYFASPAMDAACEAWLGPAYQMTAQVNVVHPGGKAQQAHRDYHLGFQTAEVSATYPAHVHDLSPLMTLQGGLAHVDVPVEAGPTKLLPFSQAYRPGYAAWRRDDFRAFFEKAHVQLPLAKGDAVFFNPALFHAAGENRTPDVHRMVNLFQVSSPFGRAMESVDRVCMAKRIFPALRARWAEGGMTGAELHAVVAATAEGYPFPTNLDTDPPVGGLAPESQAAFLERAVRDGMGEREFALTLDAMEARRGA